MIRESIMTKIPLEKKLALDYPIFQAPMAGGITPPGLVAQVSNFGMLGIIPSGYLSLDEIRDFITQVKNKTSRNFALNIFVDYTIYGDTPIKKPAEIIAIEQTLQEKAGSFFRMPAIPTVDALVQIAIDARVPALSTVFGLLSPSHIEMLKANNILIITTVNSCYEMEVALKHQKSDIIVYQNIQAGGHKGGFTSLPHSRETDILSSLKQYPDVYCVVAGGIVDKEDVTFALKQGFDGAKIGSAFIATQESSATKSYKNAIINKRKTVCTTSITGKQARGVENTLTNLEIKNNPGFPYMHYATSSLRQAAKNQDNAEYQSLWCGEGISKIDSILSLDQYLNNLVR